MVKRQVMVNEAPNLKGFVKGASQHRVEYRNIEWGSESKGVENFWALEAYVGKLLGLRKEGVFLYSSLSLLSLVMVS